MLTPGIVADCADNPGIAELTRFQKLIQMEGRVEGSTPHGYSVLVEDVHEDLADASHDDCGIGNTLFLKES